MLAGPGEAAPTAVAGGGLLSAAAALCAEGAAGAPCGEGHGGEASGAADAGLSVYHSVELSGGKRWENHGKIGRRLMKTRAKTFSAWSVYTAELCP